MRAIISHLLRLSRPFRRLLLLATLALTSLIYLWRSADFQFSSAILLGAAAAFVIFSTLRTGRIISVLLPVVVFLINYNTYAEALGDREWLTIALREENVLWASSLGSHAIFKLMASNEVLLQVAPPFFGALSTLIIVSYARVRECKLSRIRAIYSLAVLIGTLPMFSRGYMEVTPQAFPVAVLSMCLFHSWIESRRISMAAGAIATSLIAGIGHGVFLLLPALMVPIVIWHALVKKSWTLLVCVTMVGASICLVGVFSIWLSGVEIVAGDAYGGGDSRIFPPQILALDHLLQSASLIIVGSPVMAWFFYQIGRRISSTQLVQIAVFSSFVLLWNFDLGWRRDLDLIWSSSVVLVGFQTNAVEEDEPSERAKLFLLLLMVAPVTLIIGQSGYVIH